MTLAILCTLASCDLKFKVRFFIVNYLTDRFLIVLRRASVAKLLCSASPFAWWVLANKCVCELAAPSPFCSKLMEPCRDPPLSRAAISSRQLKNDCFYTIVRLIDSSTVRFDCSERGCRLNLPMPVWFRFDSIQLRFNCVSFSCYSFS